MNKGFVLIQLNSHSILGLKFLIFSFIHKFIESFYFKLSYYETEWISGYS